MELPFSKEKVFSTLLALNGDEALGLDEFTIAFRQLCWDFVKSEMLGLKFKCYLLGFSP